MSGQNNNICVLMFSGGRDSTLAALELAERGHDLVLVTITSDHLHGIDAVHRRLGELSQLLPDSTRVMTIRQPKELQTDTSFYEQTCLPCHHAYVVAAVTTAMALGASKLAFGYAAYQNTWPEQTPLATERLSAVLAEFGIQLLLPVYTLASREEAEERLRSKGLSNLSLEQKCSKQITNVALSEDKLRQQISLWENAIRQSVANLDLIRTSVLENKTLGEMAI